MKFVRLGILLPGPPPWYIGFIPAVFDFIGANSLLKLILSERVEKYFETRYIYIISYLIFIWDPIGRRK